MSYSNSMGLSWSGSGTVKIGGGGITTSGRSSGTTTTSTTRRPTTSWWDRLVATVSGRSTTRPTTYKGIIAAAQAAAKAAAAKAATSASAAKMAAAAIAMQKDYGEHMRQSAAALRACGVSNAEISKNLTNKTWRLAMLKRCQTTSAVGSTVSSGAAEAMKAAAAAMAKDYGKAMGELARKMKAAGFRDADFQQARLNANNAKVWMSATEYVRCGGDVKTAREKAMRHIATNSKTVMFGATYGKCRNIWAKEKAEAEGKTLIKPTTTAQPTQTTPTSVATLPADAAAPLAPPADVVIAPGPASQPEVVDMMQQPEGISVGTLAALGVGVIVVGGVAYMVMKKRQ